MRRVKILVEGQTEEAFVNGLFFDYFLKRNILITPILLTTKRVKNRNVREKATFGRLFKGGVSTYGKVKRDVLKVLGDKQAVVTTMIDYYGLPGDFPGMDSLPRDNGYKIVRHLEKEFRDDIGTPRFRPFLALHEYEALLFSQPEKIAEAFPEQDVRKDLQAIRNKFSSPEEINQGQETHPSARIMKHIPSYRKPVHGLLIAKKIGLAIMRRECVHFDEWLAWLESLAD
ncbi:MAG: hypothetical protein CSB13_05290 [Chloroflexi bacterium]|nr:MAG: hypothetical protein CSB13_05290 [Chloroflexota bacterium]